MVQVVAPLPPTLPTAPLDAVAEGALGAVSPPAQAATQLNAAATATPPHRALTIREW